MTAAWRPRAPLPRAAPRAAPALAPRARELWRSPAREDGPRSARRLAQSPQTPPALPRCARPGGRRGRGRLRSPPPPRPPAPGRGGPRRGLLFGKTWWRLQRNPLPARWRAGSRHGASTGAVTGASSGVRDGVGDRGGGGSAALAGAGIRFEIWWIGAACVCFGGCEGAQVLWGGGVVGGGAGGAPTDRR